MIPVGVGSFTHRLRECLKRMEESMLLGSFRQCFEKSSSEASRASLNPMSQDVGLVSPERVFLHQDVSPWSGSL